MSVVPQRIVLISNFIMTWTVGLSCTLSRFPDDTKLRGAAGMLEGKDAIHGDLDAPERCAHVNLMKSSKTKCSVLGSLTLGSGNPSHQLVCE